MNLGSITLPLTVPIVLLVSAGCASPLPPLRESPEVAVIGASIKRAVFPWGYRDAEFAYFVLLDDGDSLLRATPIRSNFRRDGYVFLFNAQPGRNGLVSAGHVVQSTTQGPGVCRVPVFGRSKCRRPARNW